MKLTNYRFKEALEWREAWIVGQQRQNVTFTCRKSQRCNRFLSKATQKGSDDDVGTEDVNRYKYFHSRRWFMSCLVSSVSLAAPAVEMTEESTIETLRTPTDRCFLEFGLCPEGVRSDRRLGDKSILCSEPENLGRISIDLYGRAAPGTVAVFKKLITSGALNGTSLSKIFPGRWLIAGQQGPRRSGLLVPPDELPSNIDLLSASAFQLDHSRPGTLSLNLSENEDDEFVKSRKGYQPLSFLITTGPGPATSLDDENIVFGRIKDGFDIISDIVNTVPTFQPNDSLVAYNQFAEFIGDERATKARAKWGKPLKAVLIVNSGII